MSDNNPRSRFEAASGPSSDDDLAINASTRTLSLTGTATPLRLYSEGYEAIAGTTTEILVHSDQTETSSATEDATEEESSHSRRPCEGDPSAASVEQNEEMCTTAAIARDRGSNDGPDSTNTVVVTASEETSADVPFNHTAREEESDNGDIPKSTGTCHGQDSDVNNGLDLEETSQISSEITQDESVEETAQGETPQNDYAESSRAVQETNADSASPDKAHNQSQRDRESRKATEEAIEREVWDEFSPRMFMLRREKEELSERFATQLDVMQRDDPQDDETHENDTARDIERQCQRERERLQEKIDDQNEAYVVELSRRLILLEMESHEEVVQEDDCREALERGYDLRASDVSTTGADVGTTCGEAEFGSEDLNVDKNNQDGTTTADEKAKDEDADEEVEKRVIEKPSTQSSEK